MPVDMKVLVTLEDEELQEQFEWIDWRSYETEVVEAFSRQINEKDALTYDESEGGLTVTYNGVAYEVPLTKTGCDRYVTICSLAKILEDKYQVWMERESVSGSDTHGILVLPISISQELQHVYPKWASKHLDALYFGIDGFSGRKIPYYGSDYTLNDFHSPNRPWWKFW